MKKPRTSYFTFGQAHEHTLGQEKFDKSTVVKITSEGRDPREIMVETFGTKWAFEYMDNPPPMEHFAAIVDLDEVLHSDEVGHYKVKKEEVPAEPAPAEEQKPQDPELEADNAAADQIAEEQVPAGGGLKGEPAPEPPPAEDPPKRKAPAKAKKKEPQPAAPPTQPSGSVKLNFFIDIETGPLPPDRMDALIPVFNPDDVALGNTKDPAKIEAKIEEARAGHRQKFIDRAALDPKYGMMLGFGHAWGEKGEPSFLVCDTLEKEKDALGLLLGWIVECLNNRAYVIGFCHRSFDLPFIRRRAFIHGVPVPSALVGLYRGRLSWNDRILDLQEFWLGPGRPDFAGENLDAISRAVTGLRKSGDGARFAELLVTDREAAIKYGLHDIKLTQALAMAILPPDIDHQQEEPDNA